MNKKALSVLEFDKIKSMLAARAVSAAGKERALSLSPSHELEEINTTQRETSEAATMIIKKGSLPLGGVSDVAPGIKRAAMDGALSITELMRLGDFLYVCRKARNYAKAENKGENIELFPTIAVYFQGVQTVPELERELGRCILNENEVADDASDKLYTIRRNIRAANERIREHLNTVIHSSQYKNMLQDAVITIRGDRFCVPIKQEYAGSFPGMVHDQSSSGATVFIEPLSVVNFNNRIKELFAEEKAEIEQILRGLSQMVGANADILLASHENITALDFIFAKGELSLQMRGTQPVFNSAGVINIIKARHPLLNQATVVPTDIYLGEAFTTLLITGPNTGGKTVCLKTIGLFTLMGQAGLHIPAFDNSRLAVFDDVFADIGDEQSIEQSLSTFSSHMGNIVNILANATPRSLVLMDELGAGTDPTEGAALAVSILEHLRGFKIRTVVTTHYSELKIYALSTESVENAACEFDVETLRPTYRLLIGVPGKSNAFAISQKLGLPEGIISAAKDVLSHESVRFEDVITDLEISRREAAEEQERARQYRAEAERVKAELQNQKDKLQAQREKIIQEARKEALSIARDAKDEADRLIKEMRGQIKAADNREIEETRRKLGEQLSQLESGVNSLGAPRKSSRPAVKNPRVGDGVYIISLDKSGIVASEADSGGYVMVKTGIMKTRVKLDDLAEDDEPRPDAIIKYRDARSNLGKSALISPEIDLRGMLVDEALERVDKYLDDAYLSGLAEVTVIHGKGTGALREGVRRFLKGSPHVKKFRSGGFGEGDAGVTVVELDK